jgi:hypothetical protein
MRQWHSQIRTYLRVPGAVGIVLLAGACSSPTATENSGLVLTARTSLAEAFGPGGAGPLLFVDVTAKNAAAVPIPYQSGCLGNVGFVLYRDSGYSGSPVAEIPPTDASVARTNAACQAIVAGSLAPDQSQTFEQSFWLIPLAQRTGVAAGTYYVAATLYHVGNATMTVDAGKVDIP